MPIDSVGLDHELPPLLEKSLREGLAQIVEQPVELDVARAVDYVILPVGCRPALLPLIT